MAYQALARKWRPQVFADVVGQPLVVRAIENAIKLDKLHHAYLFCGTRGVGKTTLARVLARALCCEHGPTVSPCMTCAACTDLSLGRYVDLIEVDAASRTKVEDTRDMLDNVPYAPVNRRFKIYLIDEVHMLSQHSFNALLKTLEEPPAHVIFLLATTEPQKVPMTVRSRCIQCALKPIDLVTMTAYLGKIAKAESVEASTAALGCIAKHAKGSLRDALSLLDQAISFTEGSLTIDALNQLFLQSDDEQIFQLIHAVAQGDANTLLEVSQHIAEAGLDHQRIIEQLIDAIHSLAVSQQSSTLAPAMLQPLVGKFPGQLLQVFYDMCTRALQDFSLLPDNRLAFEMLLLRMLAFTPSQTTQCAAGEAIVEIPQLPTEAGKVMPAKPVVEEETSQISQPLDTESKVSWTDTVNALALPGAAGSVLMNTCLKHRHDDRVVLTIAPSFQPLLTNSIKSQIIEGLRCHWSLTHLALDIVYEDTLDEAPADEMRLNQQRSLAEASANLDTDACFGKINTLFKPKVLEKSVQRIKDEL